MVGLSIAMLRPNWGTKSTGGTVSAVSAISLRSPPAQNARSPAPVSTSTLADSSSLNRRTPLNNPSRTGLLSALRASGRSMVSQATPLVTSYRTGSVMVVLLLDHGEHRAAVDLRAEGHRQVGDDAGRGRADGVLHFHRLDRDDRASGRHAVPGGHRYPHDRARHRREQRARVRGGRRVGEPLDLRQRV